jgi:hypothetical protein
MKRGARVLIVTPVFTHPPIQGNAARILAFGRELKARGITVDVVHYCLDYMTVEGDAAMRREWNAVHLIPAQPHRPQSHPAFWGIDDWCHERVCEAVAALCRSVGYDAVITSYVWMSRCLEAVRSGLKIVDTHDLFGDRHRLSLENGLSPNWFFTSLEEEIKGLDRADIVLGIQSRETREIAARTTARTMTVGHPMAPWFLSNRDSASKAAMFGYFGSGNPWNIRSVQAFDRALDRADSACDWAIAGTICKASLDLRSRPFSFGVVRAPEDFYRHVDCCINPMSGGTGLKIKTIEAMAHGRPVIGSEHAFDGLEPSHPLHRFATVEELAQGVEDYAGSEALRAETLQATRRLFARYATTTRRQYDELAAAIRGAA